MHSSSCTRPVAFVAGDFVLGEGIIADFELPRSPKACDEFYIVCNEMRRRISESQKGKVKFCVTKIKMDSNVNRSKRFQ